MNIAISSIGTATSMGIIKCIKKYNSNINIIGTDINDFGYTAGSMMVNKFYKICKYNNKLYIDTLLDILRKEKVDMFIPIHDFEVNKIANNINLFEKYKIIIPNLYVLELFSDKYKATNALNKLGILTPKIVDNKYNKKKILRDKIGVGSTGIKIIDDNSNIKISEDKFLQEYIEGQEYTVDIFCDIDGNPIIIIPRIRLEVKSGVATKVKLEYNNELINICKKILKNYKLPGLSNIQFIQSKGQYYFIEVNTRFAGAGITSILGSYNYIGDFLNIKHIKGSEDVLENNLRKVKWNSIITRYYEEMIYYEK